MWTIYIQLICITIILVVICWRLHGIYSLLDKRLSKKEDEEIEKNNVVEFVWEDAEWNWLYRIK